MTLPYGFAKATINGAPRLTSKRLRRETQYYVHVPLNVGGAAWDVAVNVGTDDADDLLRYKLVYDYHHPLIGRLAAATPGRTDLTGQARLPALDFIRSDILDETGAWRRSDPMDGSLHPEPVASMMRLLSAARDAGSAVYVFGRFYREGDGIHDAHMNQGSTGSFLHRPGDDRNDHNDVWQDGGVMAELGEGRWAAYFAAFEKQLVPTDALGNPVEGARSVPAPGELTG